MRLEVRKTKHGEWVWRKIATNGKIVSGSWESFKNKAHAIRQAKKEYPSLADTLIVVK